MKTLYATACMLAAGVFAAPQPARGAEVPALLERLENQTDHFKDTFKDALGKTVLHDTAQAGRLEDQAKKLKDDVGNLKSAYKDGKSDRELRERLDRTLARASDINQVMLERRFTGEVEEQWNEIRAELNELAAAYGVKPLRSY